MIKALRVDERLIHGQVAMSWVKALGLSGLVVGNDEAASSDIQRMTLKMAVPSNVKSIIKSLDGAITLLKDPRSDKMKLMVLVSTVKDAVAVAEAFPDSIETVNIGNAGKMSDPSKEKNILTDEVMLTESEIEELRKLVKIYPDTFLQGAPDLDKHSATAILKKLDK